MSLDETGRIKLVQPASGKTFERREPGTYERGTWDDDKTALLKKLYITDGLSCGQIAARIGATRNAVIGKVHRLGLPLRGQQYGRSVAPSKKQRNYNLGSRAHKLEKDVLGDHRGLDFRKGCHRAPIVEPIPPARETDAARVTGIDLADHHCRFIPGDPTGPYEKQYCGLQRIKGSPYCQEHAERCSGIERPRKPDRPIRSWVLKGKRYVDLETV